MEHNEFVQAWSDGKIEIEVSRSKALQVAGSNMLPRRYQAANLFWSWIWILSIPAAFVVMYFFTWWAGLLMLFILTPALSSSVKKSAMEFMIDHAVENPEFYQYAISQGLLHVRPKP